MNLLATTKNAKLFLLIQCLCFWPVWRWYVTRMLDGSDEPWGIVALFMVILLIFRKRVWNAPNSQAIIISTLITAVYVLSYSHLPPLFRGTLAVLAMGICISSICFAKTIQFGVMGLMILSLPIIASLQFYGGFPIRVMTAFASSHLLDLAGYQVQPKGTLLLWAGEVIAVDAPCAGIKMLWTGLFLNFTLAAHRELGFLATWFSTSFTLFCVFLGNLLRTTLLFFTESGLVKAPDFTHQAIGIVLFSLIALAVITFHHRSRENEPCAV